MRQLQQLLPFAGNVHNLILRTTFGQAYTLPSLFCATWLYGLLARSNFKLMMTLMNLHFQILHKVAKADLALFDIQFDAIIGTNNTFNLDKLLKYSIFCPSMLWDGKKIMPSMLFLLVKALFLDVFCSTDCQLRMDGILILNFENNPGYRRSRELLVSKPDSWR